MTPDLELFKPQKFLFDIPTIEPEIGSSEVNRDYKARMTPEAFDTARQQAFEEGAAQGWKEAHENLNTQKDMLMLNLDKQIKKIIDQHDLFYGTLHVHLGSLVVEMIKKLFPVLEKKFGLPEIEQYIRDVLDAERTRAHFTVYAHPENKEPLQERLTALCGDSPRCQILCQTDETLGLSDCRLEWEEGGIERRIQTILGQISEVIEQSYCSQTTLAPKESTHTSHAFSYGDTL